MGFHLERNHQVRDVKRLINFGKRHPVVVVTGSAVMIGIEIEATGAVDSRGRGIRIIRGYAGGSQLYHSFVPAGVNGVGRATAVGLEVLYVGQVGGGNSRATGGNGERGITQRGVAAADGVDAALVAEAAGEAGEGEGVAFNIEGVPIFVANFVPQHHEGRRIVVRDAEGRRVGCHRGGVDRRGAEAGGEVVNPDVVDIQVGCHVRAEDGQVAPCASIASQGNLDIFPCVGCLADEEGVESREVAGVVHHTHNIMTVG